VEIKAEVKEALYRIRPRSVVYLYSGGKDSSLALLLTRDFVRDLCSEIKCRVYILYVLIPGNTHPLNAFAAAAVMEWHRKHYGFEPLYKCVNLVFQEGVVKWGLQVGARRWCFIIFKDKVFRDVERRLPMPQVHIDGMSPSDSKVRSEKIRAELEFIETKDNTRYWAWHPLFDVSLSGEEKLRLLEQREEFKPIVDLYKTYGDSLNCVLCPYKDVGRMLVHHRAEDLSAIYHFVKIAIISDRLRRRFSKLAQRGTLLDALTGP
jgi:hypothetical protein